VPTLDAALLVSHVLALAGWLLSALVGHWKWRIAHTTPEPALALQRHRALCPWQRAEHATLLLALVLGGALMLLRGWGIGHARWFGAKLGLVAFLIVPLEALHAWICHGWIEPGLAQTAAPPYTRTLERGLGMDEMLRSLALPLLALGLPVLLWLSLSQSL
jgi:hypothetical protein